MRADYRRCRWRAAAVLVMRSGQGWAAVQAAMQAAAVRLHSALLGGSTGAALAKGEPCTAVLPAAEGNGRGRRSGGIGSGLPCVN